MDIRQNLKAAAGELGLTLDFRRIKDPMRIHFRVITPEEHAARPQRGGRRRKTVAGWPAAPEVVPEAPEAVPDGQAAESEVQTARPKHGSRRRKSAAAIETA